MTAPSFTGPGVVAVTGPRPDRVGGYRTPNPTYNSIMEGLDRALLELKPSAVITGMALGVDQWMAELCVWNQVPFIAAIPFPNWDSKWPVHSQVRARDLLSKAAQIVTVSDGEFTAEKMQIRNQWMVDNCERLIAVWDSQPGGTANCIAYAMQVRRPIHRVQFVAPPSEEPRAIVRSRVRGIERDTTASRPIELRPASEFLREVSVSRRRVESAQRETEGRRAARLRAAAALMMEDDQALVDNALRRAAESTRQVEEAAQAPTPKVEEAPAKALEFSRVLDIDFS